MQMDTAPTRSLLTPGQWLTAAVAEYRGWFAQAGHPLPEVIHVAHGWGPGSSLPESQWVPGQMWSGVDAPDFAPRINISPDLVEPVAVLETLCHLLCHTVLDPDLHHDQPYRDVAAAVGLVGPGPHPRLDAGRNTHAGDWLREQFEEAVRPGGTLGPFPAPSGAVLARLHVARPDEGRVLEKSGTAVARATARVTTAPARQTSRWITVRCPVCPAVRGEGRRSMKISRSAYDAGAPLCGRLRTELDGSACLERMLPED